MSQIYDITADNLRASNYRPIHAGDSYTHKFFAQRPPGTALDLTGATMWFTVKEDPVETDAQAKLALTTPEVNGIKLEDPVGGEFHVIFDPTDTENLEGMWLYDVQVKLASGEVITLGTGRIEFLPNLTRTIL